jgi:putative transposase
MPQAPQTQSRRSQEDWNWLMTEYEAGDVTQRQFCERHQLAYSTFCYWRKRLSAGAVRTELAAVSAPLLELPVLPTPGQSDWRLELELGQGMVLRLK